MNATGVVEEDLSYFVKLKRLDCSRNSLPLHPFTVLPALEELRLPCNGLVNLQPLQGLFPRLLSLDLSYNGLTIGAVEQLATLPSLRELDLTCNSLKQLPAPDTMAQFRSLEKLSLVSEGVRVVLVVGCWVVCSVLSVMSVLGELGFQQQQ